MMKIPQILVITLVASMMTACASNPSSNAAGGFMVDAKNSNMSRYNQDLHECQTYAQKKSVAGDAVSGAVTSAIVSGAIGAAIGDNSSWGRAGAKWGAIEGLASGAAYGSEAKRDITRQCLKGRGYKILN